MTEQGAAVDHVIAAGFERVGQDVVATDLDPGRGGAGQEPGVEVGGDHPPSRAGLGGQPEGHGAGTGAYLQAGGPVQRAQRGQAAEGAGVVPLLQQAQPAKFVLKG